MLCGLHARAHTLPPPRISSGAETLAAVIVLGREACVGCMHATVRLPFWALILPRGRARDCHTTLRSALACLAFLLAVLVARLVGDRIAFFRKIIKKWWFT